MGSDYLLPRLVGLSVASEFLMTGRFIDADRAKAVGLVSDVVDEGRLLDVGLKMAADMLRGSPMGLRMTKETLNARSMCKVWKPDWLCVPKTLSALIRRRNRLSWGNDRADLLCSGHPGLAIQVEEPA